MPSGVKSVRVELYQSVIKDVLASDVGREVGKTTLKVLNRAKVLTPVDTGNLRASHMFKIKSSSRRITGEVFTKVKYALPVHEGRGPVTIYPKKKQALAFHWHGQQFVRKSVFQHARRGRPWLRDALREIAAAEGYKMQAGIATADTGSGDL